MHGSLTQAIHLKYSGTRLRCAASAAKLSAAGIFVVNGNVSPRMYLADWLSLFDDLKLHDASAIVDVAKEGRRLISLCGLSPGQTEVDFSDQDLCSNGSPADVILIASDLPFMAVMTACTLLKTDFDVESAKHWRRGLDSI